MTDVKTAREKFDESFDDLVSAYGGIKNGTMNDTFREFDAALGNRQFLNEEPDVHVGSEYSKRDYYSKRQSEKVKTQPKLIMKMCGGAYENVGIVKNTVDLMGDFASKGLTIVHKNKKIEKFLRQWYAKVNGDHVTERLANTLYRLGNVVIEQMNGKITKKAEERWKSVGFIDSPIKKREIPNQYIIHNPCNIEKIVSPLSSERARFFLNDMKDHLSTVNSFTGVTTQNIDFKKGVVELNQDRVFDYYYKKDDWEVWAKPMTYAIMNELMILDKVQLADISALDGAISNIRLWRLGDFDNHIFPTREGMNKLRRILANSTGGGVLNLVWGPELDFKESNTEVHHFLGKEKYEAILTLIYAGLGIPPTMTGGGGAGGGGFTNNMVSIKTLVERLEYGRNIIKDFWSKQLDQVMRAMGFPGVARVVFTHNALSDEAAEKALLIDLVDRDLISADSVRSVFGFDPDIEQFKINRESRSRGVSTPYKSSPYHNPQPDHDLKKTALNTGLVSPSEVGLDLDDKKEGEESLLEINQKNSEINKKAEIANKPKGDPGRPFNAKDGGQRKKKAVRPRSIGFITDMLEYQEAYDSVSKIVNPAFMKSVGKNNKRQLTKQESADLERLKFHCLAHIGKDVSEETVKDGLGRGDHPKYAEAKQLMVDFNDVNGREPTADERKDIFVIALTEDTVE